MSGKSRFNASLAETIFSLAQKGATEEEIAANLGITTRTLRNWKGRHPDFLSALKDAKAVADDLVEASLFQRAVGYSQPAQKIYWNKDAGAFVSQTYVERFPPDVTACIFWLKNRRPTQWRDADNGEFEGDGGEIAADWRVSLVGEQPTLKDMRDAKYYDRKPPALKVVTPDESD